MQLHLVCSLFYASIFIIVQPSTIISIESEEKCGSQAYTPLYNRPAQFLTLKTDALVDKNSRCEISTLVPELYAYAILALRIVNKQKTRKCCTVIYDVCCQVSNFCNK